MSLGYTGRVDIETLLNLNFLMFFMVKGQSFNELVTEYGIVLVDTSAFSSQVYQYYLTKEGDGVGRIKNSQDQMDSIDYFIALINQGTIFYTTRLVADEICHKMNSSERRALNKKDRGGLSWPNIQYRKCKNLVKTLREEDRFLILSDEERELYLQLVNDYSFSKQKYGLSETDFDLFLSGAVIAERRGKAVIVSNDSGMARAWRHYTFQNNVLQDRFGFFFRNGRDAYSPYNRLSSSISK